MFVAYTLPSIYHPYSHQLKWFSAGGGTVPEGGFFGKWGCFGYHTDLEWGGASYFWHLVPEGWGC